MTLTSGVYLTYCINGGFNYGTIRSFAPFIQSLSDTKNCHYKGCNVAFPYVNPAMADFSDIKRV